VVRFSHGPLAMAAPWSPDHLRLHRQLLRDPALLPAGATLLVAVSGGQDSMALLALLGDLRRLHHWRLQLWHGNHNWRPEAGEQAGALAAWTEARGLPLHCDTWARPAPGEAAARAWRYGALAATAERLGASHVVTGHTGSDRAETLLLNLARGSHRRGLASLTARRGLDECCSGSAGPRELQLVRPLLGFSRADTARICQELALPIWPDPSNHSPRFSRNRIRQEVVPVLEQLHPGAERRISALAERLAGEERARAELLDLALRPLAADPHGEQLHRPRLLQLQSATRSQLLHHWLQVRSGVTLSSRQLQAVLDRIQASAGPNACAIGGGWHLSWQNTTLWLCQDPPPTDHERIS